VLALSSVEVSFATLAGIPATPPTGITVPRSVCVGILHKCSSIVEPAAYSRLVAGSNPVRPAAGKYEVSRFCGRARYRPALHRLFADILFSRSSLETFVDELGEYECLRSRACGASHSAMMSAGARVQRRSNRWAAAARVADDCRLVELGAYSQIRAPAAVGRE
jgi:hypothetical protein